MSIESSRASRRFTTCSINLKTMPRGWQRRIEVVRYLNHGSPVVLQVPRLWAKRRACRSKGSRRAETGYLVVRSSVERLGKSLSQHSEKPGTSCSHGRSRPAAPSARWGWHRRFPCSKHSRLPWISFSCGRSSSNIIPFEKKITNRNDGSRKISLSIFNKNCKTF